MRQTSQRGFYASAYHRHIGIYLFENLGVDNGGIVGACAVAAAGSVGVVTATTAVGRVVVDHRVHCAGADTEEKPRLAKLAEVAQVVLPVGLGHDSHLVAVSLENAAYHCSSEGRMVNVGVA